MRSPTTALLDALTSAWGKPSSAKVAGHGIQVIFNLDQTPPAGAIIKLMRPELRLQHTPLLNGGTQHGSLITIEGYGTSARITISSNGESGSKATATVFSAKGLLSAVIESIPQDHVESVKAPSTNNVVQLKRPSTD